MCLTLITPTRNRSLCFSLLEGWVAAQRDAPIYQWIVINDGVEEYNYTMNQEVYKRQSNQYEIHSLCANLLEAMNYVRGNSILILEDDDFYRPMYIATMCRWLSQYPLAGEGKARYYNVKTRRARQYGNRGHASLSQTGFRREVFDHFRSICATGNPFVDLALWRSFGGGHVYEDENMHIGIKGMPGEVGIGQGHRAGNGFFDHDLATFREWQIPELYEQFYEKST